MAAVTTLAPVFFMLILGFLANKLSWVSKEHKEGANSIVFNVLFPILVFNLLSTTQIEFEYIWIVLYVFCALFLALMLGRVILPRMIPEYGHLAPYLLSCVEGGAVALPLYLSIVGTSSNTVIFDLAGTAMAFGVVNIMVANDVAGDQSGMELVKSIFSNSFVIAVIAGLILNFTGIRAMLGNSAFGPAYEGMINQATQPIVGMILFILGYDLTINKKTIVPICKLLVVKTVYFALVIAGFFVVFPTLMADHVFMLAPMIYFMCPTGFGLLPVISPVYRGKQDEQFASAFISLSIIVTLIVYTCIVLFVA